MQSTLCFISSNYFFPSSKQGQDIFNCHPLEIECTQFQGAETASEILPLIATVVVVVTFFCYCHCATSIVYKPLFCCCLDNQCCIFVPCQIPEFFKSLAFSRQKKKKEKKLVTSKHYFLLLYFSSLLSAFNIPPNCSIKKGENKNMRQEEATYALWLQGTYV